MSPTPHAPAAVLAEVVARFGERVIDVQHVGSEPEPRVPTAGWYTLGACTMLLGLGLVAMSLPGDPPAPDPTLAADTPPIPRSGGAAGLGALLVLLGVVPLVIGGRSSPVPRDRYIIGEGPHVHLPVPLPPGTTREGVPLVRALEQQIVLGLVPGMTGELHDGERTISVADLVAQGRSSYALPTGARGELVLGQLRFTVAAVERASFIPERGTGDRLYLLSNIGALAALAGLLWLGDGTVGQLEVEEASARRDLAVRYLTTLTPPPASLAAPPPVPKDSRPRAPASRPAPTAAPPAAAAPPTVPLLAAEVARAERIVPRGTRRGIQDDHSFARNVGILNDSEFIDSIDRGTANTQEGLLGYDNEEDRKMWAAVLAAPVIDRPFGGLELAETERGGGVHDDRPRAEKARAKNVKIDMFAPRKPPSAAAVAAARRVVSVRLADPNVVGELTDHTVREYLRKQSEGLKRCFRDNVDQSDRVGTVLLRIKVDGDGKVTLAKLEWGASQLGPIGPCLTAAARGWRFPAPTDRRPASIVIEAAYSAKDH